jgi:hypothetical protein
MSQAAGKLTLTTGASVGADAVAAFARRVHGPAAHQALPRYYTWLYAENPHCANGLEELIVAVDERQRVKGFVNRLFMPWDVTGQTQVIPAIGDLVLDEAARAGGAGLRLILAATRGVEHAFVNGSNPRSSPLFRSLKYQELTGATWYRHLLRPVHAAWGHMRYRAVGHAGEWLRAEALTAPAPWAVTAAPRQPQLRALADLLNAHPAPVKPRWDADSVHWRFFHPEGPRHVLLHNARFDAALVLSIGRRLGATVCRPIAYRTEQAGDMPALLQASVQLARKAGADAYLAFTTEPGEKDTYAELGFKPMASPPGTFFHHRKRAGNEFFDEAWVQGAASDLGFEAIRPAHAGAIR